HQRIHSIRGRIINIDKSFMRSYLELFSRLLVNVGRPQDGIFADLGRQGDRSGNPGACPLRSNNNFFYRLVKQPVVIRFQFYSYFLIHHNYSNISVTTPAPTVLPPSRMANRSSFSIAMGAIISTDIVTLSPGITISIPSGSVATPVTSVVLK